MEIVNVCVYGTAVNNYIGTQVTLIVVRYARTKVPVYSELFKHILVFRDSCVSLISMFNL